MSTRRPTLLFALVAAVALAAIYAPGLNGPFLADDMPNFVNNDFVAVDEWSMESLAALATSNRSGPLGRPLPALSFGLNYWFAGQQFAHLPFKLTNLVLHLLTAVAAFALGRRLLRAGTPAAPAAALAGVAALAWAVHPIQLTNVLYVVQRINAMAALAVLAGLLVFVIGRQRLADGRPGAWRCMLAGVAGGTVVGLACKENAVLLPALALVIELTVFRARLPAASGRSRLVAFYAVVAVAPYALGALYAVFWLDLWAATYAQRDFSLAERLLTQPRVLVWYVGQLLAPNLSELTFVHDDWQASRGWLSPVSTLLAALALALAVVAAALARRAAPWFAFAVAWFLAAHALEASVVPLELVYEHRNYLPSFGLALGLTVSVWQLAQRLDAAAQWRAALAVLAVAVLAVSTFARAGVWSDASTLTTVTLAHKPGSARIWGQRAMVLKATGADVRDIYLATAMASRLNPRDIASRIELLKLVTFMQLAAARFDVGGQPPIVGPDGAVVLALDEESLASERRRLDTSIGGVLAGDALGVVPVIALRELLACIDARQPHCVALIGNMHRWLSGAHANPALNREQRQLLLWLHARITLESGDAGGAIALIERAVALAPRYMPVRHHEIAILIRAGRLDLAGQRLAVLAGEVRRARDVSQVRRLKEWLDAELGKG